MIFLCRDMAHIHEKIDFTVEVLIVHKNKVLLRRHDKYNKWLSVGGHIELDENPVQAAIREVKEEVGLDIELIGNSPYKEENKYFTELIPPVGLNRNRISETHEHVTLMYFARAKTNKVIPEKETDEWKWCTMEDIDELEDIPENIVYYAKRALKELGSL